MFEIFQYDFMIRALLAGLLISLVLPVLGVFLVARRYALIADSLSHVSLAGVGAAILAATSPLAAALPVAVGGAVLLEWLRGKQKISGETGLALLMSGGLAVAVVCANLARNTAVDFNTYLFGSISTTTSNDLILLFVATLVILLVVGFSYRSLLYSSFDEDAARASNLRVTAVNYALVIMTAVMVVFSLRIIGGLLLSALIVVPVVAASQVSRSFRQTVVYAVLIALLAVIMGLIIAFYAGIAAGGAIVLTALAIFGFILLLKK